MSGKAPEQKGNRVEREIVKHLQAAGLDAKCIPLSGSTADYPGHIAVKFGDWEP